MAHVQIEVRYRNSVGYGHCERRLRYVPQMMADVVKFHGRFYVAHPTGKGGRYFIELTEPVPEADHA